ncbi:MAG: methyl-accepting chemotaxis protein, partial [Pirellulaceae bacterium]|nr:methyl-accepting chemotaxis protein [Pirellulaceae bacterium]
VYKLLLATILPAALIWLVGIYATSVSQRSLRDAIEATSATRAREVMDEIDWIVQTRATTWQAYLRAELVQRTLKLSNDELELSDDPSAVIAQRDQDWQSTPSGEQPELMKELVSNDLARDLSGWLTQLEEAAGYPVFGEVFLTNRFGGNVAQTSRTSDYRQDDEEWWQLSKQNGVYISDVEFDESAQIYSVDICIAALDEDGNFLGVMKTVMNTRELLAIMDKRDAERLSASRLILFNREQKVIHESHTNAAPLSDRKSFLDEIDFSRDQTEWTSTLIDDTSGDELLCAFAASRGHGDFSGMGWVVMDARKSSDAFAPIVRLRNQIVFIAILSTVLVALAGWLLARSITAPIRTLLDGTTRIGQGELDHRIVVAGHDEITKLGNAFNEMAANLQKMILDLTSKEEELTEQYQLLASQSEALASQEEILSAQVERDKLFDAVRDAVGRLNAASEHILSTTSKQAKGSSEQAVAVSQTATTMDEVAQIADQNSARANNMVVEAKQAEEAAQTGREAMETSIESIASVKTQAETTAESILSLAERAEKIGAITATVNDIAEQTNVLALNAAVEASRAGEHGRGFAVVAAEVKALAQQSKDATREVRQILTEIVEATGSAVMSTEKETKAVIEAGNVAVSTGGFVNRLLATISSSARNAKQISEAAKEQATGVIQLNKAIKNIETVAAENAIALQQIEQSAMDLNDLSTELAKLTAN